MRNIISGVVGIVFGIGILIFFWVRPKDPSQVPSAWPTVAMVIGGVMAVAGVGYLIYGLMNHQPKERRSRKVKIKRKSLKK